MAAASDPIQTITRLTPLAEVLATVDSGVKPVTPRPLEVAAAAGRILAADAVAPARPSAATALQDGWALAADDTLGAGGYAPVPLMRAPQRVEAGQPMPAGTDSVAPLDAVKVTGSHAEALVTVNPGDGVLAAGGDSDPGIPLRQAGERLRGTDLAAFAAAGLTRVTVREPRIRVLPLRGSGIILAAARLMASDIGRRGGAATLDDAGGDLGAALADESDGRDHRDRRHRQRPQRCERTGAGARGSRCNAWPGAHAGRDRRARICRSATRAVAAGTAGRGA